VVKASGCQRNAVAPYKLVPVAAAKSPSPPKKGVGERIHLQCDRSERLGGDPSAPDRGCKHHGLPGLSPKVIAKKDNLHHHNRDDRENNPDAYHIAAQAPRKDALFGLKGGRHHIGSGSTAKAKAGKPSVTRFIQRISGVRGVPPLPAGLAQQQW